MLTVRVGFSINCLYRLTASWVRFELRYTDAKAIYAALDLLRPEVVISGCQTGADTIALNWASERGVETAKYPYLVDFGRSGGPKRNQQMLEEGKPDLVLAFPGGRGTADMVRRAKEAGIRVVCQKS